jgi:hypothetical protein
MTTVHDEVNDLLTGGGAPAAKFPTIGTLTKGVVLRAEARQQRDMNGVPKCWDDGNKMMEVVITLQTDERDPAIDQDTGSRNLYVRGKMLDAVRTALKQAGGAQLEVGGTLAVKYIGDGTARPGLTAPKLFQAQYARPAPSTDGANDLLGASSSPPANGQPAPVAADESLL